MSRKKVALTGLLLLIGAVAVPLIAAGTVTGGYLLEKQPGFCALCHEMQPSYDNWRASGAARDHPDCIQCHKGPGLAGILDAQRRGVQDIVAHVSGNYPRPIVAQVPDAWCTQCHTGGEITNKHHEVPEFGVEDCAACHNHAPGASFKGEEREEIGKKGKGNKAKRGKGRRGDGRRGR